MPRAILVVAVEASADRWAAPVARRLARPAFGVGGAEMRAAGVRLVADLRDLTAMGTVEVLPRVPALVRAAVALHDELGGGAPAGALLVDGPDVNLPLAGLLARRGVPVVQYVAPQTWAWRSGRVHALARHARRVAAILPFEEGPLRAAGVDARFVGHPLLDWTVPSRAEARRALGLGDGLVVAVVPGSRPAEIARHLAPSLDAARQLAPRAILVPLAPSLHGIDAPGATVVPGPAGIALAAADVAIVASGTATLESVLARTPPVILHRTSAFGFAIARALVRAPFVGLPNLVLGRAAFPEVLQADLAPDRLAREAEALLARPPLEAMDDVRTRLGTPGVADRVADLVREVLA